MTIKLLSYQTTNWSIYSSVAYIESNFFERLSSRIFKGQFQISDVTIKTHNNLSFLSFLVSRHDLIIDLPMAECGYNLYDAGLILNQHCFNVWFLMGSDETWYYDLFVCSCHRYSHKKWMTQKNKRYYTMQSLVINLNGDHTCVTHWKSTKRCMYSQCSKRMSEGSAISNFE